MIKTISVKFNVKLAECISLFLSHSPPLLYINRNLALPSLCKALHKDGFGEHFEQQKLYLGDDKVFMSFWSSDDNYFIKPEGEVFPEQKFEQTMGGM